jgi:uncharacterized protein YdeI (YjbR/CyaY-like superfamily)
MTTSARAPRYFRSRAAFRAWLERQHAKTSELWIGFYKKASGKAGLTYPDAVEEALCFGWIDGVKKRVDESSFTHRFTPRRASSKWSQANLKRVAALKRGGLMAPAGLAIYRQRRIAKTAVYLFEQTQNPRTLDPESARQFRAHPDAWEFFQAQPPGYRRLIEGWIVMAKRDETRAKRLAQVIAASLARTRVRWM